MQQGVLWNPTENRFEAPSGAWKPPCLVAMATNVNVTNPGTSTFDGQAATAETDTVNGSRIFLMNQTAPAENGAWVFNGSTVRMSRPPDMSIPVDFLGATVKIQAGTYAGLTFRVSNTTAPTVDTTAITIVRDDGAWDEWKTLFEGAVLLSAATIQNYPMRMDGGGQQALTVALGAWAADHPLDPAQYAVLGKTVQCRVIGKVRTGSLAPLSTFGVGLYPINSVANHVPTLGAVVGSSGTVVAPALNTESRLHGTAFTMPAAGSYILIAQVTTANMAATSTAHVHGAVQIRVT